ncbi:MAG: AAA family ATPase [Candidatus Aenigmarchaeota archaeon]|nr:AAA family ATPase [Candidatus Aenigmarchaeota archaeon]
MNRIQVGIEGLDALIGGGIPEHDLILLSGRSGAGKTIFGLHFLLRYAEQEPGIFVSFEEELAQIRETAKSLGWDIERLEREQKIRLLKYDPFRIQDIFDIIANNIQEIGAKRIVIDSISSLGIYVKDPPELRRMILEISSMLRKYNTTGILISEIVAGKTSLSRFGVEEFVVDGVILLHTPLIMDEYRRGIGIVKMRGTAHTTKIHPYKISEKGFVVYPNDIFTSVR